MFFPILCVDDFYKDPDKVRKLALEQKFNPSDGLWPGSRTETLDQILPDFFNEFGVKLFSLYYDFDLTNASWHLETYFQKIDKFSEDKNDIINSGWIHTDGNAKIMAGVIYLNETSDMNCGTSLFKQKKDIIQSEEEILEARTFKRNFFSGKTVDKNRYRELLSSNHNSYEEISRFGSVYNRMICYDSDTPHKANGFYSEEPRLTQVFFLHNITTNFTPIGRAEKHSTI